jgi:hypothetical protein
MKYFDETTSMWIVLNAKNLNSIDGLHFRINNGKLQYSTDGNTWVNAT